MKPHRPLVLFYSLCLLSITFSGFAQNLVVNPGAELTPLGTGWTVTSAGGSCASGTAAFTFNNWTMVPDHSANYPIAHGGTHTFFAGCTLTANSSYQLYQDIDVSADAVQVDQGNVAYVFSGYIQTPVSTQADAGRFTVDYLNASAVVLGTSYTAVQSNATGSGVTWNFYTNSRTAPTGTRTVRIRLTASISATPAINAYFDDISLVRSYLTTLPVTLLSFNAQPKAGKAILTWTIADAKNFDRFEIERSTDQQHFATAGFMKYRGATNQYTFTDSLPIDESNRFYRLKMIDLDGKASYSSIVSVKGIQIGKIALTPNPARGNLEIKGLNGGGTLTIATTNGVQVSRIIVRGRSVTTNVSHLPKGMYLVTYTHKEGVATSKLIID